MNEKVMGTLFIIIINIINICTAGVLKDSQENEGARVLGTA